MPVTSPPTDADLAALRESIEGDRPKTARMVDLSHETIRRFYSMSISLVNAPEGSETTAGESDASSKYWAAFGQATWRFADQWHMIVGGRYSYEKVDTYAVSRSNGVKLYSAASSGDG